MIHDLAEDPGSLSPAELRQRYERELREAIEDSGVETVSAQTDIDRATIDAIAAGEMPEIELTAAAAILATQEEMPDAETIAAEARDDLLMGMTTAVLDVDTLEGEVNGRMDAREIQQKIEGRFPMTLSEYALLHHHIEARTP